MVRADRYVAPPSELTEYVFNYYDWTPAQSDPIPATGSCCRIYLLPQWDSVPAVRCLPTRLERNRAWIEDAARARQRATRPVTHEGRAAVHRRHLLQRRKKAG